MAFRRFRKRFEYINDEGQKVTVPRNWAGELPEEIVAKADKSGATLIDKSKQTEKPKASDERTKDQLLAEASRRKLAIKSSATKPEILTALQTASAPFAKPVEDLTDAELAVEAKTRGLDIDDEADSNALRAALMLAFEPLS
ncbi:MAG: hypothetical protein P0Y65_20680 [Candidatus Devosia phytovorans]|uniref:Uncharacterized protein n=1 Tax=Candidatus Devosia phytovorans TaxID=3121372 RepID=A0AAJ5VTK4_9HYPH|nr:hypothetical protein [Devosia sp.]WEK04559.1 MAG: hypothetical protein P0Y65_20680 [Devosia sp.]